MIVYRVQDSSGRGHWKPGFSHKWVIAREDHANLIHDFQEWPDFDPAKDRLPGESLGCGCMSVPQLQRWFTKNEMFILRKTEPGALTSSMTMITYQRTGWRCRHLLQKLENNHGKEITNRETLFRVAWTIARAIWL